MPTKKPASGEGGFLSFSQHITARRRHADFGHVGAFLRFFRHPNAVGYNTLDNGEQTVMLGCQFVDVADGESGILLGELKSEFEENDEIQIVECDKDGVLSSTTYLYWIDSAWDGEGWYDAEVTGMRVSDTLRIPNGGAVWFTGVSGAKGVTAAGQVYGGQYVHHFTKITEMVCSAFPIAFNPNAVKWEGLEENDEIQVTTCDENGVLSSTTYLYWIDSAWDGEGWYDAEVTGMRVSEPIVAAGQGFWLTLANPTEVTMIEETPIK